MRVAELTDGRRYNEKYNGRILCSEMNTKMARQRHRSIRFGMRAGLAIAAVAPE
jgi:hypothetical protein